MPFPKRFVSLRPSIPFLPSCLPSFLPGLLVFFFFFFRPPCLFFFPRLLNCVYCPSLVLIRPRLLSLSSRPSFPFFPAFFPVFLSCVIFPVFPVLLSCVWVSFLPVFLVLLSCVFSPALLLSLPSRPGFPVLLFLFPSFFFCSCPSFVPACLSFVLFRSPSFPFLPFPSFLPSLLDFVPFSFLPWLPSFLPSFLLPSFLPFFLPSFLDFLP
jgi:hypothetical protein